MRTITEIQADINMMQQAIQNAGMGVDTSTWQAEKAKYEREYATAETYWAEQATQQAQTDREQAQTEKVESVVLPLDLNKLYDNTTINDIVIEIIQTFQKQAYTDHNAEVAKINADWTSKLQTQTDNAANQLTQLQARLDSELLQGQEDAKAFADLEQSYAQCLNDRKDAESKRDAAAQEIIRLNSHIDDLQQQLANAPAPKAAIEIGSSDRLAELVVKAKESTAAAAARGLARWNTAQPDHAVPALDIPSLPQITEEPAAVSTPQEIPTAIPSVDGHTDTAQVVGTSAEATVTRAEHEALKARVATIEAHANISSAA